MPKKHQELIDAVNLIAEYVSLSIPGGYTVRLDMRQGEAELAVLDADRKDLSFVGDGDESAIVEACDFACHLFEEIDE